MNHREQADETRLDWALREVTGNEAPPDLSAAVVQRHRRGDAARLPALPDTDSEASAPPRQRWLAAALLLLGVTVVAAVARLAREHDAPPPLPAQEPAAPPPASVSSRATIEALPADTRSVLAQGLDDDAVRALLRLRDLRELEIRYPEAMVLGLGLKTTPPRDPPCITAKSFATFAQLTKLRALRLRGAHGLTESFPLVARVDGRAAGLVQGTLGELERLPLLEELALSHFDLPPYALAALPKLRSLRRLDLSANYGVDGSAIGSIVQCRELRALSLRACMTLPGSAIARLSELPHLEELDVGDIDDINWRSAPGESFGPETRRRLTFAHDDAKALALAHDMGLTDRALEGLQRSTTLRTLRMSQPNCTVRGITLLRTFPALVDLDVFGAGSMQPLDQLAELLPPLHALVACGEFGDTFCARLRERMPELQRLELPACYEITDRGLAELCAITSLRHLDIRQDRGLTAASMQSLLAAKQLEFLDVRHIDWVTKDHVQQLRKALPHLHTLFANADGADDPAAARR